MKTADFKGNFSKFTECSGPINIIFKCWFVFKLWFSWRVYVNSKIFRNFKRNALRLKQGQFYYVTKAKRNTTLKWKLYLLTSNESYGPTNIIFNYWFVLKLYIWFHWIFYIDSNNFRKRNCFYYRRLKQGKFYWMAKSEAKYGLKIKTEFAEFKWNFSRFGPLNIIFKLWVN